MVLKNKFFEVDVPLTNTKVDLLAYNLESLNNRTIKLDLTRQLRGKSIEVVFKVQTENGKAFAEPTKLTLLPFFIRRMLRKSISYVEDSYSIECEDAALRVKPFLITRKKVSRKVRKALREETQRWLEDYIKDKDYRAVFSDIIGNRLQKQLSLKLKKIYPLALCEIRILKVEKLKEQEKIKVTTEKVGTKQETQEKVKEEKTKEEKKEEEKEVSEKSEEENKETEEKLEEKPMKKRSKKAKKEEEKKE